MTLVIYDEGIPGITTPESIQKYICKKLSRRVRKYLQSEESRKDFEQWYLKKYGKPYQWKKGIDYLIKERTYNKQWESKSTV